MRRLPSAERFDRWAGDYDDSQLQGALYEPVHRAVLHCAHSRLKKADRVLDVGCGTGRLARQIAQYTRVVALDASSPMIERARSADCRNVDLTIARAERLPFRDAVFELVLATFSLRHWPDPGAGLAEIRRVMAPGATLVVADAFPCGHPDLAAHDLRVDQVAPIRSAAQLADLSLVIATRPR
ncbi:methyltransferase domain-containing protein [Actinomadura barringtoniae]|uniref:Methyltransferase domain-containing protein n=1 Tax=Actinomadura barringtoniae TaxID=1427535 RepID=A0A939PB57_9ACTN|nr:methyltransferase domain-containing protein [Actinomadura barringtoniae]MBO2446059.1 methyltransferase domain-containing protein [Actinomadura barringtoniae]